MGPPWHCPGSTIDWGSQKPLEIYVYDCIGGPGAPDAVKMAHVPCFAKSFSPSEFGDTIVSVLIFWVWECGFNPARD